MMCEFWGKMLRLAACSCPAVLYENCGINKGQLSESVLLWRRLVRQQVGVSHSLDKLRTRPRRSAVLRLTLLCDKRKEIGLVRQPGHVRLGSSPGMDLY